MTAMSVQPKTDEFLFDVVRTESLIAGIAGDSGPVARTCNCFGTCGPGLCSGSCCSNGPLTAPTALEI
jgi:hypothetical protein